MNRIFLVIIFLFLSRLEALEPSKSPYQNAASQLELYQRQIFDNTRALLRKMPSKLLNNKNIHYRVVPIEEEADPAFIDVKISGPFYQIRGAALVGGSISIKCMEKGHPIFYRQSMGFYHPNCSILFAKESTTIRLTVGLDPAQVDIIAECFEMIDTLNGNEDANNSSLKMSANEV